MGKSEIDSYSMADDADSAETTQIAFLPYFLSFSFVYSAIGSISGIVKYYNLRVFLFFQSYKSMGSACIVGPAACFAVPTEHGGICFYKR
jgi:hypothetical protein